MKCSRVRKLISRYVDEELHPDEKSALDRHVRGCLHCRQELEADRAIHRLFASAERFEAPPGFAARVTARIEEERRRASFWSAFALQAPFLRAVEAALALVIILIGMVSGTMLVANRAPEKSATLEDAFSLDLFQAAPPDSLGDIYARLSEETNDQ